MNVILVNLLCVAIFGGLFGLIAYDNARINGDLEIYKAKFAEFKRWFWNDYVMGHF